MQLIIISNYSYASTFEVIKNDLNKKPIVVVSGEIQHGDEKEFVRQTLNLDDAVIIFHSPGGNVVAAIEIGKAIRLKEFYTYVPKDMLCASACAISWLGGSKRFMSKDARIGFHAAYRLRDGQAAESGLANALIGGYLNSIGLPQRAIAYVTSANPNSMQWINYNEAIRNGIDVTLAEINTKNETSVTGNTETQQSQRVIIPQYLPQKNVPYTKVMPPEPLKKKIEQNEETKVEIKVNIEPPKENGMAEKYLQSIMNCGANNVFKPEEVIRYMQKEGVIGKKPIDDTDGVPVYRVIKPIRIFEMEIVTISGWNDSGGMFFRVPGTQPRKFIGVGFNSNYGDDIKNRLPAELIAQERKMWEAYLVPIKAQTYSKHETDGSYATKKSQPELSCVM